MSENWTNSIANFPFLHVCGSGDNLGNHTATANIQLGANWLSPRLGEVLELYPDIKLKLFEQEVAAFPEYYEQYFKQAMMGGAIVSLAPVVCVGPVKYRGEKLVQTDIDM